MSANLFRAAGTVASGAALSWSRTANCAGGDDPRQAAERRRQAAMEARMSEDANAFRMKLVSGAAAAGILGVGFLLSRYKRCPSNQLLIISGLVTKSTPTSSAKCLHGGGTFVWPILQEHTYLSLEPMPLEIKLRGALSLEKIRVNVPSVFTVAVGSDPEVMEYAAKRLVGLSQSQVAHQAEEIVLGQLRQVIASLTIEEINRDRDAFIMSIEANVDHELKKVGLVLINVNITDVSDESGFIEQLGKRAAAEAIQQAMVQVAEKEKIGGIGVANHERDRQVGVKSAEKTAAVDLAALEAEKTQGENESHALVAQSNANLTVQKAEAYRLGETSKRQAEASVQEAESLAQAKAAIANAEQVEAEKRAELEAPAKAFKAEKLVHASAEAEAIQLKAEADAKAYFLQKKAEADGEYEVLAKKAAGLEMIVQGCGGSDAAFRLLMLEHLDTLAETSAKAVSNIKFDKVVVWDGGSKDGSGKNSTSEFIRGLAHSIPPTLDMLQHVAGLDTSKLVKTTDDVVSDIPAQIPAKDDQSEDGLETPSPK